MQTLSTPEISVLNNIIVKRHRLKKIEKSVFYFTACVNLLKHDHRIGYLASIQASPEEAMAIYYSSAESVCILHYQ